MTSLSKNLFPLIEYSNGNKVLVNDLIGIRYKSRPEEYIRLAFTQFLLLKTDIMSSRIGFEIPIKLNTERNKRRADIIIYDENFNPFILVECKSNDVTLSHHTAIQALGYNKKIQAPYLILTNGIEDLCYRADTRKPCYPDEFLQIKLDIAEIKSPEYWEKRAFLGRSSTSELKNSWCQWLNKTIENHTNTRLLLPKITLSNIDLNHYYFAASHGDITITADRHGYTHLICFLKTESTQPVLFITQLDTNTTEGKENTHCFSDSFHKTIDLNYFTPVIRLAELSVNDLIALYHSILNTFTK